MTSAPRALVPAAVLVAAVFAATCSKQPSGHERMLALLDEIAARTADEHVFQGDRLLRQHRADLLRLGDAAPWRLCYDAGVAALNHGNEREAIELLERGKQRVPEQDQAGRTSVDFMLGVAWLRLAETANCCAEPSAESCILPIQGDGVHRHTEGSTRAIACFLEVVQRTPPTGYWHLAARWLLNIAHMTLGSWPEGVPEAHRLPERTFAAEADFPRFRNVAAALGLDTLSLSGGAIGDDFDGDGWIDLVVSTWDTSGQLRYYRNQQDGTFADRTRAAGLMGLRGGLNLVQADYDNDGHLDFLVLRGAWLFEHGRHPNSLVRNNGDGTFTDVTFAAGLGDEHYPTQTAAFADYDHDGDLDLYIGNESSERARFPSQLFRNNGDGTFTDVAAAAGVQNFGFAKAVAWGDIDNDGWPDLFVSNQGGDNRLYRNRGDGTFVDVAAELGVTRPQVSFPAWFWDFDNDGALDLFVSAYCTGIGHLAAYHLGLQVAEYELARIYRGDGRGGFADATTQLGFDYPAMPMGSNFGDIDNDGWLDCYLGTGDPSYFSLMPNVVFRNLEGQRLQNITMASGLGHVQKGHAVVFADFDNDGDLDVFEQLGGAYRGDAAHDALFENPGNENGWLSVQLVGSASNRSAIGARLRLVVREDGRERSIHRVVGSGGSFGGNPLRVHFGIGRATAVERLEVFWPRTRATQRIQDPGRNRTVRITEGSNEVIELPLRRVRLGGGR